MAEVNWALSQNGASVAGVSQEASQVSSAAQNLLSDREDQLWITGDAPQSVTLMLEASHPPLRFAGWHVWHDYLTNPKRVEIASGESSLSLTPLLVCQALPGAGTQVWQLPKPIPSQHRYVRVTILETFGPGPTYMNNIVLLASDPGPNYCGSTPAVPRDEASAAALQASPSQGPPPVASASRSRPTTAAYAGESNTTPRGYGSRLSSQAPSAAGGPAIVSPRPSGLHRYPSEAGDDTVGVFTRPTARGAASTPTAQGLATPTSASAAGGGGTNSGRMSQLLRDLDEDIRSLRPLRTVTPKKDMLVYVPRSQPMLPPEADEDGEDSASRSEGDGRDDSDSRSSTSSGHRRESKRRSRHRRPRSSRRHRRSVEAPSEGRDHRRGTQAPAAVMEPAPALAAAVPPPPQHPPPPQQQHQAPWPLYPYPMPAPTTVALTPMAPTTGVTSGVFDRIAALEQAVASLTQTVQHQREDITMMKRLLLQQAQERRKEAEQARELQHRQQRQQREREEEWHRRLEHERRELEQRQRTAQQQWESKALEKNRSLVPVNASTANTTSTVSAAARDLRLTHHHVGVDFPEDALRGFVQSVLDEKMKKGLKKSEAKVLNRLDAYLHDVVANIADGVDERVQWHLEKAEATERSRHRKEQQQQQQQQQQAAARAPPPAAFGIPALSIDQTMLSGSSGGTAQNTSVQALPQTQQPPPQRPLQGQPLSAAATNSGGGFSTSTRATPVGARSLAEGVPNAAPAPGGPSPHRYDMRSYVPPTALASPPQAVLQQQHQQQPVHYLSNRYAPFS